MLVKLPTWKTQFIEIGIIHLNKKWEIGDDVDGFLLNELHVQVCLHTVCPANPTCIGSIQIYVCQFPYLNHTQDQEPVLLVIHAITHL